VTNNNKKEKQFWGSVIEKWQQPLKSPQSAALFVENIILLFTLKLTVLINDDCFQRCADGHTREPQQSTFQCVPIGVKKKAFRYVMSDYGYVMISRCPTDNPHKELESLCTAAPSTSNLFAMLPVSDRKDNNVYKNVFCAICNHVSNYVYWQFSASCGNLWEDEIPSERSEMLNFVKKYCEWHFQEPTDNYQNLKKCLAVKSSCTDSKLVEKEPLLPSLCSFYVLPDCSYNEGRNPHCAVCSGKGIDSYNCDCSSAKPGTGAFVLASRGLDVLFDFSSSYSHSVKVRDKTTVVKNKVCDGGYLFDPFAEKCVQIYKRIISTNETYNGSGFVPIETCNGSGFIPVDRSSATQFSNGSIWILLHNRLYDNGSYFINGSSLFVCMNLTRNFNQMTRQTSEESKITPKQIITYIGCSISMLSLILLLGIYIAFAGLRTLPGKNLMSLSCAMLLYHTAFFLTGQTNHTKLCTTASVLLHYFLLSSFCWMSVIAFDVAKTFGRTGKKVRYAYVGVKHLSIIKNCYKHHDCSVWNINDYYYRRIETNVNGYACHFENV